MAQKIGSLFYEIYADTSKMDKGLAKSKSGLGKMSDGFQKLTGFSLSAAGAIGLASVAIKKAIDYSKVAIDAASDLAETESKVGVVFGDQADAMLAWGETAAEAMGMSSNEALAAAGTYGNLFRAMGITEKASADMSQTLVELAADLASFNNMDPTEVLGKLRAGLSGETEPLKTLGVNLNQAIIQQKALELGLWDGVGALDAAEKAQASYALILEQTSLAQGDFERTADGLANKQRILKAASEDLAAAYGEALVPAQTQWVEFQIEFVTWMNKSIEVIADNETALARLGIEQSRTGGYIKDGKRISAEYVHEALRAQNANDAWSASLEAQAAAWLEHHPQMKIAVADYSAVADAIIPLNAYMSDLTTELIFQQAAAGLDAEAQFALAEAMGLISPQTKYALDSIQEFKDELSQTGDLDTYIGKVDTLAISLERIKDRSAKIKISFETGNGNLAYDEAMMGIDLNGNGIIGAATGLSMTVPPGYPNDSYLVGVTSGEKVEVDRGKSDSGGFSFDYNAMARAVVEGIIQSGAMVR